MNAPVAAAALQRRASPFEPGNESAYRHWRAAKLAARPRSADELIVPIGDPHALTAGERQALLQRCAAWNMAVYRLPAGAAQDKSLVTALGRQLGLSRLDANWLADEDGVSSIAAGAGVPGADRAAYIPYTDRPLQWHTDGYYHPGGRRIRSMLLHCARPAAEGGANRLIDHELAYIALRDACPAGAAALMADDAMTIPPRLGEGGEQRPACAGPVFSVDPQDGALHMRYTARTRSIEWKRDAATGAAVAWLAQWLAGDCGALHIRLDAGMGIVAHNVLHDRSAFRDDPQRPRLVWRARYADRTAAPAEPAVTAGTAAASPEPVWRNG